MPTPRADALLAEATAQTNELVNEHEIMQRAYAHANEVIEQAQAQAQAIVDSAVNDANNIRQGSIQYTDDMLKSLQNIINHSMEGAQGRFDAFMSSMQVQLRHRFLQPEGAVRRDHHRKRRGAVCTGGLDFRKDQPSTPRSRKMTAARAL